MARHRHSLSKATRPASSQPNKRSAGPAARTVGRRRDFRSATARLTVIVACAASALAGVAALSLFAGDDLSGSSGDAGVMVPLGGGLLPHPRHVFRPKSLRELLDAAPERLATCDIARVNMLCAEGLPGAKNLDIETRLATLDAWAERVRFETERHLYRAHDPRWAERYHHSESYLRAGFLCQVLQEDCGARYNPARIRDPDFTDCRDLFIHGLIDSDNGGTCVSMPVLYVAVGRRLGYPLRLVVAKRHIFCRWNGDRERFNMESTGPGFDSFDDEYYRKWPGPISDEEVARGEYLKSLTPSEGLSVFLASRGHCLFDTGRLREAHDAYAGACRLMPQSCDNRGFLADVEARLATERGQGAMNVTGQQWLGSGTRP